MNGQAFDHLTTTLAVGTTRRGMLRRTGGGLAGGLLTALGLGRVAAQQEPVSPTCRQCINMFFAQCVSACVRQFPGQQAGCEQACFQGELLTCTILGECGTGDA